MTYTNHAEIVRPKWDPSNLPSLVDKVAIVTGANTSEGVGYHIAHQLALKGAKVYIGARSLAKAQSGIEEIMKESPQLQAENLKPLAIDLGNLKEVKLVAEKFGKEEDRLDILVNNAGLLPGALEIDKNGVSTQIVVNHLAPMLLTLTLLPLLKQTALEAKASPDVRIVNVNSTAHVDAPSDGHFRNAADFNATFPTATNGDVYTRYGHSKLANALFSVELQRRLITDNVPIIVTYPHPGGIASAGAANFLGGKDNDVFKNSLSPYEGALTPLWCAAIPEVKIKEEQFRGRYILPFGGLKEGNTRVQDEGLRTECWEGSQKLIESVLNA
ncbi:short-chain dehydrogenase [Pyrenochaeta sp. MPI-SDFR-AT-0127]|nr:short-chain dehydrogenase [Pyrenochaeta sp. MPI-SDFR-AT-0127]